MHFFIGYIWRGRGGGERSSAPHLACDAMLLWMENMKRRSGVGSALCYRQLIHAWRVDAGPSWSAGRCASSFSHCRQQQRQHHCYITMVYKISCGHWDLCQIGAQKWAEWTVRCPKKTSRTRGEWGGLKHLFILTCQFSSVLPFFLTVLLLLWSSDHVSILQLVNIVLINNVAESCPPTPRMWPCARKIIVEKCQTASQWSLAGLQDIVMFLLWVRSRQYVQ